MKLTDFLAFLKRKGAYYDVTTSRILDEIDIINLDSITRIPVNNELFFEFTIKRSKNLELRLFSAKDNRIFLETYFNQIFKDNTADLFKFTLDIRIDCTLFSEIVTYLKDRKVLFNSKVYTKDGCYEIS